MGNTTGIVGYHTCQQIGGLMEELIAQVKETFPGTTDEWCESFIRAALQEHLAHYKQTPCDTCDLQVNKACVASRCPHM